MTQAPISAVMITHNSERRLVDVLKSLEWCAEVILVDSGSTDQTLAIASAASTPTRPVKVFQRKFDDFSKQKQASVDYASQDWVMVIDSDERVSEALQQEIVRLFQRPFAELASGYELPRVLYFLGKRVAHGGGSDHPLRLFNRKLGRFNGAPVHEKIVVTGKMERLLNELEHYSYDSLDAYFKKFSRYTTAAAEELYAAGKRAPVFKLITSFPAQFIKLYFFKLGILDGIAGFLWCFFSAVSPVVKYSKLLVRNFQWLPKKY